MTRTLAAALLALALLATDAHAARKPPKQLWYKVRLSFAGSFKTDLTSTFGSINKYDSQSWFLETESGVLVRRKGKSLSWSADRLSGEVTHYFRDTKQLENGCSTRVWTFRPDRRRQSLVGFMGTESSAQGVGLYAAAEPTDWLTVDETGRTCPAFTEAPQHYRNKCCISDLGGPDDRPMGLQDDLGIGGDDVVKRDALLAFKIAPRVFGRRIVRERTVRRTKDEDILSSHQTTVFNHKYKLTLTPCPRHGREPCS
jgi:hypothetical protein